MTERGTNGMGNVSTTVLGADDGEGRWQLRLWWKPFVALIWAGGALIALGGLSRTPC